MKTILFIFLATASAGLSANLPDSIIINAGKNSRIIFYGKTPQDLKNIERLDLNKLLHNLNQKQDSTQDTDHTHHQIQMSSKSFESVPQQSISKLRQFWKHYKLNTFLNTHIGWGGYQTLGKSIGEYEYFKLADPNVVLPNSGITNYQLIHQVWLRTRSVMGLSLLHDATLIKRKNIAFKFRYGLGLEAYSLRFEFNNFYNPASADDKFINAQWKYIKQIGTRIDQTDIRAVTYFAQLMPKIFFVNKNGRETFSFGVGVKLNASYLRQPIDGGPINTIGAGSGGGRTTKTIGPVMSANEIFYKTKDSDVFGMTFLGEIGYRSISLFAQYTPAFTTITPTIRVNTSNSPFNQQPGNLGFVNFGLKFGR